MTNHIHTTRDLMAADFEDVELAKIRLAKGEHTRFDGGRIVGRYRDDLILRYRGHEVTVTDVHQYELTQFKPVVLDAEKKMIRREWEDA